LGLILNCKVE